MQDKIISRMADEIVDKLIEKFENTMTNFVIYDVNNDLNHKAFKIDFTAYNYFNCTIGYDMGRLAITLQTGKYSISLVNGWYEKTDFDIFFKELKEELELRIPDKYLEAKGWK